MTTPRVRFAPSPTGYLHVGGARTALFNWLYARKVGGCLVLRIEDTDQQRSTNEHTQVILDGLTWLGVTWDEGPFFQGAYAERHRQEALKLLAEGKAYKDFLTAAELTQLREAATTSGNTFRFSRELHALSPDESRRREANGEPYTIRFAVPDQEISWDDAVHGRISWQGREIDDFIILRSDGSAIYNMAVVSDDIAMGITHVIRGDDHISNTPKQIALYQALGKPVPVFAHLPMILGTDGKKLSKRHGATAVGDYRNLGILPAAMRNFLALLGWAPGNDEEIISEDEMIRRFALEDIQKKAAVFDTTKLEWMNGQYLSALPADQLREPVVHQLELLGVVAPPREELDRLIDAVKARSRTITQLAEQLRIRLPGAAIKLDAKGEVFMAKLGDRFGQNLGLVQAALEAVAPTQWDAAHLEEVFRGLSEKQEIKLGDLMQPVRIALTGGTVSEPVNELLVVIGRSESLRRLGEARPH